jgi:hypothetical protein
MRAYRVTASAIAGAPARLVYAILADYRNGHGQILPQEYFPQFEVEEGGVGAGTVIRFQISVLGSLKTFRASVEEPEPDRVLVETDLASGARTTFTVLPVADGARTRVTISTELVRRGGVAGLIDRSLTRYLLRRIYRRELRQLDDLARKRLSAPEEAVPVPA